MPSLLVSYWLECSKGLEIQIARLELASFWRVDHVDWFLTPV